MNLVITGSGALPLFQLTSVAMLLTASWVAIPV